MGVPKNIYSGKDHRGGLPKDGVQTSVSVVRKFRLKKKSRFVSFLELIIGLVFSG